jgi:anti-sigma-K factor RskA
MNGPSPFDHTPDPELGAALRAALSPTDDAEFRRRVVAASDSAFAESRRPGWWDVLAAWVWPGLAAALVLVAVTAIWLRASGAGANGPSGLGDPLAAVNGQLAVPALLASPGMPDVDIVLAVALEN